jgi:hypothetical protein
MPDTTRDVRAALAGRGPGAAWDALELAQAAAFRAGAVVLSAHRGLPPADQFALALQAADEVLEALAVELAGGDLDGGTNGKE